MTNITIIGAGNMGSAITRIALAGGHSVQLLTREVSQEVTATAVATGRIGDPVTGDIVVLALPYSAVAEVLSRYGSSLDGRILVDVTNPVDMSTFDTLVVPVGGSAAAEIAQLAPAARVLKAFNTNFASTLATGTVGAEKTAVLIAGDDPDAKAQLAAVLDSAGVKAVDAGSLKRAHELEALGFLQLTLAASEKTSWTSGFALAE